MIILHNEVKVRGLYKCIDQPQNIVMYLHSLAIHQMYDKKVWDELLRSLLLMDLTNETSDAFHRTLALSLELYQTEYNKDNHLVEKCKSIINLKTISVSIDPMLSRGSKYYQMCLYHLGYKPDQVHLEYKILNGLSQADIYLKDLDMVIDIHGPVHYLNGTTTPIDSMLYMDRLIRRNHKYYVVIDYRSFDLILTAKRNEDEEEFIDLEQGAKTLKKLIDLEINKSA